MRRGVSNNDGLGWYLFKHDHARQKLPTSSVTQHQYGSSEAISLRIQPARRATKPLRSARAMAELRSLAAARSREAAAECR